MAEAGGAAVGARSVRAGSPHGRPGAVTGGRGVLAQPGQGPVYPTRAAGARGDSADLPSASRPRRRRAGLGGARLREGAVGKGLPAVSGIAAAVPVGRCCWFVDYEKEYVIARDDAVVLNVSLVTNAPAAPNSLSRFIATETSCS